MNTFDRLILLRLIYMQDCYVHRNILEDGTTFDSVLNCFIYLDS